jgi:ribosome modulation factor
MSLQHTEEQAIKGEPNLRLLIAYDKGCEAREAGIGAYANPYCKQACRESWDSGWRDEDNRQQRASMDTHE